MPEGRDKPRDSDDRPSPGVNAEGAARQDARRRRLAEALRENLQKRKQQSRVRTATDP
jgi:hypothetical protein